MSSAAALNVLFRSELFECSQERMPCTKPVVVVVVAVAVVVAVVVKEEEEEEEEGPEEAAPPSLALLASPRVRG